MVKRGVAGAAESHQKRGRVFAWCAVMDHDSNSGEAHPAGRAVAGDRPVAVAAEAGLGAPLRAVATPAEASNGGGAAAPAEEPELEDHILRA